MAKVRTLVKKEGLTFATLWLFQVMALSAGLYRCQVWASPFLPPARAANTGLYKSQALFFKRFLGLPYTTNSRCVLRECGQLPVYFFWFRCHIRFWNSCLHHPNPLVQAGLRADWRLAFVHKSEHCWVNELFRFLEQWVPTFAQPIRFLQPVPEAQVCRAWSASDIDYWSQLQGYWPSAISDEENLSRVKSAYHYFFALAPATESSWSDHTSRRTTDKPPVSRYLCVRMSKPLYVALAWFRLSAHSLAVVQGRWAGVPYLCKLVSKKIGDGT